MDEDRTTAGTSGQSSGMTEAAQQKAVELKDEGTEKVRSELDERTTEIGSQARALAQSLRRAGNESQSNEVASRVAVGAADRLERAGEYLERARGDDLLHDAERFARERPWVVAGVAAAVGFAASRLLKASSERRYETWRSDGYDPTYRAEPRQWDVGEPAVGSRA
jgi:ElaB/YqjD/DUF883 family membrane-anchored ribosome-binding protein